VIVIDSAPVLLASEGLVVAGVADMILLLVKWRTTPRAVTRKAATMITRSSGGPCLTVLSQVNVRRMASSQYYYGDAERRTARNNA
jgi:succinoglycan biosynthesis transport protein ExoP